MNVCIKLPGRQFDQLYQAAVKAELTVPELIRRELKELQKSPR